MPPSTQIARRERYLLLITAAFLAVGTFTLATGNSSLGVGHCALVIFAFAISFATAHAFLNRYLPHRDPLLLPVAALFLAVVCGAGCFGGWLRERYGNVWPAMLCHGGATLGYMFIYWDRYVRS